jgi:hypothetical protein
LVRTTFAAILVAGCVINAHSQSLDAGLEVKLRAKDERLLNAVHRGDRKAWEDSTTPDFMYIEDGDVLRRAPFLSELEEDGLAPLIIRTYEAHRSGDTVMVLHMDDVPNRPSRDTKNSHLLMTEIWQRAGDDWKLRLVDINRLRMNPPAITLSPSQLDELVGTYRAGSDSYVIRRDGDRLLASRSGGPEGELKAETRDVLFTPGDTRNRKIFQRDASGRVTGFADRSESSEVNWIRSAKVR